MEHADILIVDDDSQIRAALARELSQQGYRCLAASNAVEAMAALYTHGVDAIISDFEMPGMDGLELLQRVRLIHPRVFRVLLTGRADLQMAVRALNEGAVHRFLMKPWDRVDLGGILEMALHSRCSERIRIT